MQAKLILFFLSDEINPYTFEVIEGFSSKQIVNFSDDPNGVLTIQLTIQAQKEM